jgi:hypothetical protein
VQVLAPGQTGIVTLVITIPVNSSTGISHTSHITSFLEVKPTISTTVVDRIGVSSILEPQIFLPLILKQ